MRYLAIPLFTLAIGLAACAEPIEERDLDDTDVTDTGTLEVGPEVLERAIDGGDFASLELGARIDGPDGPEVVSAFSSPEGNFADVRSFVACPTGTQVCNPQTAPAGAVYTYVHTVFPGEDNDPDTGSGEGNDASDVETASAFMMTMPAYGFNGVAGYSHAEAVAAGGSGVRVIITCGSDGNLVWTVNSGDGGDQWEQSEPMTFYWQSTLPPAGPQEAYAIEANRALATGSGPFPAPDESARNACMVPSTAG